MKAVLVIDMPEHCYECPLVNYKHCNANYFVRRNHGGNISYNFSNEYIHEQGRQTWCPLRPLPQELDNISALPEDPNNWSFVHYESLGYEEGWNACLEKIMGETE